MKPMPRRVRQAMAILHIVSSVALLGSAGAVGVLVGTGHPSAAPVIVHTIGIPLALAGLVTGLLLALGTRWGLFRHAWVTVKLALLLLVLAIGVVGVRPALADLVAGDTSAATTVSVLNATQLLALFVATVLSVTKPRTAGPLGSPRARSARPRSSLS